MLLTVTRYRNRGNRTSQFILKIYACCQALPLAWLPTTTTLHYKFCPFNSVFSQSPITMQPGNLQKRSIWPIKMKHPYLRTSCNTRQNMLYLWVSITCLPLFLMTDWILRGMGNFFHFFHRYFSRCSDFHFKILQRRWIEFRQRDTLCREISVLLSLLTGSHLFILFEFQTCIHSVLILSSPVNIFQSCRSLPAHSVQPLLSFWQGPRQTSDLNPHLIQTHLFWWPKNVLPVFIRLLVQFHFAVLLCFVFLLGHCS